MIKQLVVTSCLMLLTGCSTNQSQDIYPNIDTTNLSQLENVHVQPMSGELTDKPIVLSNLRARALEDSSMSIGAQSGLAWASRAMNEKLNTDRQYLDSVFNFNGMVLDHGVIPPVLEQGDNSLNLNDPDTIRVADRTYKIIKQAHFGTTPPNWRDYLWLSYNKPELPDRTLLPRTKEEEAIWRKGINKGWQKGIEQAYSIFNQNLASLKRDFRGMALYKKLLEENMISAPFVARTELGVTGDGTDMRVNDQVLRIVQHPQLQTKSQHWNAVVVKR